MSVDWNTPQGALQNATGVLSGVIHIRHPLTQKALCNQTMLSLVPIGMISTSDPAIHDACLRAWFKRVQT